MESWESYKKRHLRKGTKLYKEYMALGPEFKIISKIIELRIKKKLTQKQIANRIGTKQSAISRFESGKYNPSVKFLEKAAKALGSEVSISLK